jgi:ADP-L-glycero-D-manno-heptose 6-epimerase
VDSLDLLQPLNPYGRSKHSFDLWVRDQKTKPPFWAGFKFFNVFGPNEYHKHRMASVVYHAYHQIVNSDKVRLFRSNNPKYADGEQLRDFIYVKDVLDVLLFFMENRKFSDLYNLGTGTARSFNDLAKSVFLSMDKSVNIEFIDIPEDIKAKYQYYTCADMVKIRDAGYGKRFMSLEDSVSDYVQQYLMKGKYL